MNAINSKMPAIRYQGPAQRFQLVNNRDENASLIQDQKSEVYFGTAPLSVEYLHIASFAAMRDKGLSQELNAELTAAEVAKHIPEGEKLEILDKTSGGKQDVDRVIIEENPAKPGHVNVFIELGPQGGMSNVMQSSNGLLTWEY